ncbi:MAG: glucose 1-dehydrogenase [Pirellulaceae bacterium]|nr:glucose 1-dehydrogenase [Pirellulaceae bacterium]
MRMKDKVAVITGASVGIGHSTATLFAREGAKVVVNSQSDRGVAVVNEINTAGGSALFVQGDVTQPEIAQQIVDTTVEHFGRLDVLVNNAGIVTPGTVDSTSVEEWDRMMAVNVRGVFLLSKAAVIQMLQQGGGVIVHNASIAGVKGLKDRAGYCASKGAVVALTKAMAIDYVDKNIRVNCVNPGTTLTPSLQDRINAFEDPVAAKEMFISRQPMGRLGESDEIAAGILYLASDESSFVTGAILNIDGGLTI